MAEPMTFGVELEFALACLAPYDEPPNIFEQRAIHFDTYDFRHLEEFVAEDGSSDHPKRRDQCMHESENFLLFVTKHIEITFRDAGYPVQSSRGAAYARAMTAKEEHELDKWYVKTDWSVQGPPKDCSEPGKEIGTGYRYLAMEVVSPVFEFSEESLQTVADVCQLLNTKYLVNTNDTTGLHVHVGNEYRGYTFENLRKIAAFFWTFTPQLNMLHSPARQTTVHTGDSSLCSLRERSLFVSEWTEEFGARPEPIHGVDVLLQCTDQPNLLKMLEGCVRVRSMAYNFWGLGEMGNKPTIEFRQHDGTIDGTAVTMWVKTVVKLVDVCQRMSLMDMASFLELISLMEKWERYYDGHDAEREAEMGPPLAENGFTVLHLLRHYGLYEEADYYEGRGLFYHHTTQTHRDVFGCDSDPDSNSEYSEGMDSDAMEGVSGPGAKNKDEEAREKGLQEEREWLEALTNHTEQADTIYWRLDHKSEFEGLQ